MLKPFLPISVHGGIKKGFISKSVVWWLLTTFINISSFNQKFTNLKGFIIFSLLDFYTINNGVWSDPFRIICSISITRNTFCNCSLHKTLSSFLNMHSSSILSSTMCICSLKIFILQMHTLIQWLMSLISASDAGLPPSFSSSFLITLKSPPITHGRLVVFLRLYIDSSSCNLSLCVHLAYTKEIITSLPISWFFTLIVSIWSSSLMISYSRASSINAHIFPFALATSCCIPNLLLKLSISCLSSNCSINPTK